jgi:hypothetical protein
MATIRSEIDNARKALRKEFQRTHRFNASDPLEAGLDYDDDFDRLEEQRRRLGIDLGSLATTMQLAHMEGRLIKRIEAIRVEMTQRSKAELAKLEESFQNRTKTTNAAMEALQQENVTLKKELEDLKRNASLSESKTL